MRLFKLLLLLLMFLFACNKSANEQEQILKKALVCKLLPEEKAISKNHSISFSSTQTKAKEALNFCAGNKMNKDICLLADMSLHSGIKRFVVWDFIEDTILYSFLVGHGCCDNPWYSELSKDNPQFSNLPESHCSSLGKYKIGKRAYSDWGINVKYFLHGLESTNSNALGRYIVLHSWDAVSDEEIYPNGTPEGWGCPTLSNNSFRIIDSLLQSYSKPTLLWIYN